MTPRRLIAALLCMVCVAMGIQAQHTVDNFHFTHFKSVDGLPHQQINAMTFAPDGRLWVGTRNGLASFDGYSFTTYYHEPGNSRSLPHNYVICMLVDSHGRLWVGTDNGLCRYVAETDDFEPAQINEKSVYFLRETLEGNIVCSGANVHISVGGGLEFRCKPRQAETAVRGMAVSHDNRIFISTDDALTIYDSKMQRSTQADADFYSAHVGNVSGIAAPIFFDSKGRLWIGLCGNGVMCNDIVAGTRTLYDDTRLSNRTVRVITEDRHGRIWVGTERGINIIDPVTKQVTQVTQDLVNPSKLNDNAIYCILPDRNGNMWIGTYFGGINLVVNNFSKFAWTPPGYDLHSLRGKAIRRIVEPQKGQLWLASEDGGINIMDLPSRSIREFSAIPGLGPNVHELYFDRQRGEMWIGTFLNGLYRHTLPGGATRRYLTNSGLPSTSIFAIANQKTAGGDTHMWVGTTEGLRRYDPATDSFVKVGHTTLDREFVYSLLVDRKQNLWIGTVNSGLFRLDAATGEIRGWNQSEDLEASGFKDHYITALLEDSAGRIFVGTNNGGLYYFQPGNLNDVKTLGGNTSALGTVCALTADRNGKVWMSTSNGLYSIEPSSLRLQHYTVADGLPENQFNFNSAIEASDGRMYFGTVNGLVSFSPLISKHSESTRPVHFSSLSINGKTVAPGVEGSPLTAAIDVIKELKLNYKESRQFSILYGVIDPQRASSTFYQVKVDGIDSDWHDVGNERRFTGMELAPGTYTLHVRASDSPDDWEGAPVRSLRLVIAPPFYRSVWAYCLYLLILLVIGYFCYRLFNIRMREKQQVRLSQLDKAKSEVLRQEKMEFFTNISHELKTPLSLILAPLKYIEHNQPLTPESRRRLELAMANTNKMVGLIDELVTFNRVENGTFKLYLQKGNPLTYIEKLAQFFYATAEERRLSLHISVENNGEDIWFSSNYVERIVNNLLSNAIKYTPAGGEVNLHAAIVEKPSATPGHPGQIYLNIEVRDTGIGIAPEELDKIFQKYYQTRKSYDASNQGWGIGLATVKKLVEIHGGSIEVESTPGQGSVFRVSLLATPDAFPRDAYMDSAANLNPVPSYRSSVTDGSQPAVMPEYARPDDRTTILLVEDNPELLTFLSDTFGRSYRVLTATNGVEALKITASNAVDIVVSDVMMPEMDGIELCSRLKNDVATSHIPVILLTAKNDEQSTVTGYESGAEAYVAKPFDPQILELRVKNILRARRRFINSIIESSPAPILPPTANSATNSPRPNTPSGPTHPNNPTLFASPFSPPSVSPMSDPSDSSDPSDGATFPDTYPPLPDDIPTLTRFDQEFLERINALVEANIDNSQFSIADITREMGISRSLLHIKMKSFANASMTDYIRKRRMTRACELLRQGYNVSETAYRTGYADPNYFTKVFKKEFSLTPTDFLATP